MQKSFGIGLLATIAYIVLVVGIQAAKISTAVAQQAMSGKALYEQSCLVCHGEDGDGAMPGVSDLTGNKGALKQKDAYLMKSIREGVQKEGAAMMMPPLGGNPKLTDSDIEKIIQYMRKHF